ncbi:MAG TPA: hypothetical protein PKI94_08430, partial [Candidatus Gastranaerophilaceae bacterium]|nr:hypothetical protein [Candidatus Gastranaerophilaceae bacterium]
MDKYCVQGENNKIILIEEGIERELGDCEVITGLNIEVKGNNNRIKLELPTVFLNNTFIQIGNDGVDVTIKKNCRLKALFIRCCFGANQKLEIGEGTTFNSGSIILDENAGCLIGNDCMFSSNI